MMRHVQTNEKTLDAETLGGRECDWSTLVRLAGRVLDTASLAVMTHAQAEDPQTGSTE